MFLIIHIPLFYTCCLISLYLVLYLPSQLTIQNFFYTWKFQIQSSTKCRYFSNIIEVWYTNDHLVVKDIFNCLLVQGTRKVKLGLWAPKVDPTKKEKKKRRAMVGIGWAFLTMESPTYRGFLSIGLDPLP